MLSCYAVTELVENESGVPAAGTPVAVERQGRQVLGIVPVGCTLAVFGREAGYNAGGLAQYCNPCSESY